MFFQDLFAGWLQSAGWITLPPGTPDPRQPAVAMAMLRDQGCKVFARGIEPPVPAISIADAEAVLLSQHYTVLEPGETPPFDADDAVVRLRECRWTLLPPEEPPALGFWVPGDSHPLRLVRGVSGDAVTYGCQGHEHTVKIKSFHQWRRDHKAVHKEVL